MVARELRLRAEYDVRRVRNRGKSWASGPLVARVLPNELDPPRNRYAVIAGKRCGNAVQRNRLKRLTREAIRHLHPQLTPGYDLVLICRGTVEEMPGLDTAKGALERIVRRAGLLRPLPPDAEPGGATPPAEGQR